MFVPGANNRSPVERRISIVDVQPFVDMTIYESMVSLVDRFGNHIGILLSTSILEYKKRLID